MLTHGTEVPESPHRVLILGTGGFIGGTCLKHVREQQVPVIGLTRSEIDLLSEDAASTLARHIEPDDALVVISARAPVKDNDMLLDNIAMMKNVCSALEQKQPKHIIYISSDAVYADSTTPLTENSCAEPGSLHGAMHLTRELMLAQVAKAPLAILRPTLVYGLEDPHNGYGPNRFRRLAVAGEDIVLFGEGEERRDHVHVEDIAGLVYRVLCHQSEGVLNIATGTVTSFREIAEITVDLFNKKVSVKGSPRQGPMPHGGYRPFDSSATQRAFADFQYTGLKEGLARVHAQWQRQNGAI